MPAPAPGRRSALFVWHGAEERGLLGSRWYAAHPTVPAGSLAGPNRAAQVPRGEGVRILGVLYSSSIFPGQAPEGRVLLRVIAGGSVDPAFSAMSSGEMLAAVRRDLRVTLGVVAEPEYAEYIPWPQGIPQYELGHGARIARAETALARHPGLFLTGNAYRGVGVNDTVRDARRAAREMLQTLSETLAAVH